MVINKMEMRDWRGIVMLVLPEGLTERNDEITGVSKLGQITNA